MGRDVCREVGIWEIKNGREVAREVCVNLAWMFSKVRVKLAWILSKVRVKLAWIFADVP